MMVVLLDVRHCPRVEGKSACWLKEEQDYLKIVLMEEKTLRD